MKKIIVIDDDQDILALVKHSLSRDFEVAFADTVSAGERLIAQGDYDLVILDENLPDGFGTELLQRVKSTDGKEDIPIVMLTQRKELKDKLNAFEAGADDYISKPFEPLELLARVNARLRGTNPKNSNLLEREDLKLDLTNQHLTLIKEEGEEEISLTPIEFKILYQLAREEGVVRSRADLLETVWGKNQNVIDRTVDQHVSKLRKKLEGSRMTVKSLHKKGYLLAPLF
ncbi:MAG: response regulator transcription factor [Bdellovibrionota bacterium]|jgi:DNA-binding response OmpR family regulator|nr:response regulator transcription factor [Bdellovibrionota bacterium]